MIKNYDITVNFSKNKVITEKIILTKDDNISTQLSIIFEDLIPDGQNVKMTFKNPNNVIYDQLLQVIDKKATYLVPNTLLLVNGYGSISFTYINGEEIYTNTSNIEPIDIRNNLGEGQDPTPEQISAMNQAISQLNSEIVIVQSATTNANTATVNANESATNASEQAERAKNEADSLETVLFSKADKTTTYTKAETDTLLNAKENAIGFIPEDSTKKGMAYGYAGLDENGKIQLVQIPDSLLGQLQYQGIYDVSTNVYPSDTTKGHYYIASTNGVINTIDYKIGDWLVYNGTTWDKVDNTDAVASVNGKIGVVVLTTADIEDSTDKRYVTELEKVKIANSLIVVEHDNSLSGSGTTLDPLKVVKNEVILADYATWYAMKQAGTLDSNVQYFWGSEI